MSELSYEEAIKRLEEIVSKLSDGECSLSESIELFDEGTKLAGLCNELLNKAEQRIKVISKGNENE